MYGPDQPVTFTFLEEQETEISFGSQRLALCQQHHYPLEACEVCKHLDGYHPDLREWAQQLVAFAKPPAACNTAQVWEPFVWSVIWQHENWTFLSSFVCTKVTLKANPDSSSYQRYFIGYYVVYFLSWFVMDWEKYNYVDSSSLKQRQCSFYVSFLAIYLSTLD